MIELRLDYDGEPYLRLVVPYGEDLEKQALELFIREARRRGVVVKNESLTETSNCYATIRLGDERQTSARRRRG